MANSSNRIRRLKHIEAFAAVISTGSISAAARQLGVSQPAVSQLIKTLEDAIGAQLFVRRNGAIFPTSRAENLRDNAVDLLAQLDRFQAQLSYGKGGLLSTIRISATMSFTSEVLPRLLEALTQRNKEMKFYVSSVPLSSMITSLVQGHIDFAFHTRPLDHPGIYNEVLTEVPQVAIMPSDHPLAQKDKVFVSDFKGSRVISSTPNDPSFHFFNRLWRQEKVPVFNVLQSPFAGFSMQMVRPLKAVTFTNELFAKFVCSRVPGLAARKVEGLKLKTPFYLACADWQQSSETKSVIENSFYKALENVELDIR